MGRTGSDFASWARSIKDMGKEHIFQARTTWTGAADGSTSSYESYSREYLVEIEGKPKLKGSAAPPYRGDASLHNPEDLLLTALSTCHMLSFLALAAMAGIKVTSYVDECSATMTFKDGKMRFVEANLKPRVTVAVGTDLEKADSLHVRANQECFIANSVNFPVHHEAETLEEGPA